MIPPTINGLWGALIVEELIRSGVAVFGVSPGSRSTPLALAVAENPRAQAVVHFDERGTAFHALGWAKATGRPAALICTSGTAVANYFPAVVEAAMAHVPLILLTADRPPELLDAGANQAIDQTKMFGGYVRWQFTLPCPDEDVPAIFVLTTIDHAVSRATRAPAGPVHVNCMCREPLAPAGAACDFSRYLASAAHWLAADAPYTTYAPCQTLAAAETLDRVTEILANAERGLVIVGQLKNAREAEAVRNLARALGWPVFPDIASGLRLGVRDERVIPYFDQLLLSARFQKHCAPGTVLQIGSPFVSKRLLQQLEACPPRAYVHVADHPCRHDPIHRISLRIETDAAAFCEQIAARLPARETSPWLLPFQEGTAKVHTEIESFIERDSGLHEPTVARALSELMAEDTVFFLGNSLPIRDVERFASPQGRQVRIAVNRGASGIDGDIATAAGYAAALRRPVTVLLGDLALLHDLNSLALLRELDAPMVVVVLNNNGGGIFSFLPIAGATPHFERFFATPHGLAFQHAAELFDLRYYAPDSRPAFVAAYRDAVQGRAGALIEVRTEREENVRVHRALQEAIAAALDTVPVPSQR